MMHDYQKPDRGWCGDRKRGAAMGRISDLDCTFEGELSIRKVPIDEGGYDPGGTYWGIRKSLFCVSDGESVAYLRAGTYTEAKERFPKASWKPSTFTKSDLEDMLQGYVECVLFTTEDDEGEMLDRYSISDIAPDAMDRLRDDCANFVERNKDLLASLGQEIDIDWNLLGHDFWLERSGSGGFDTYWPRHWTERLSAATKPWQMVSVYLYAEHGRIHMDG